MVLFGRIQPHLKAVSPSTLLFLPYPPSDTDLSYRLSSFVLGNVPPCGMVTFGSSQEGETWIHHQALKTDMAPGSILSCPCRLGKLCHHSGSLAHFFCKSKRMNVFSFCVTQCRLYTLSSAIVGQNHHIQQVNG